MMSKWLSTEELSTNLTFNFLLWTLIQRQTMQCLVKQKLSMWRGAVERQNCWHQKLISSFKIYQNSHNLQLKETSTMCSSFPISSPIIIRNSFSSAPVVNEVGDSISVKLVSIKSSPCPITTAREEFSGTLTKVSENLIESPGVVKALLLLLLLPDVIVDEGGLDWIVLLGL